MNHAFTSTIKSVLHKRFQELSDEIFERSFLIQYLNQKTRSANKGAKSRGSFGALYSIYTLVEDYLNKGYPAAGEYSKYEGARQTQLIERQRELDFGKKLQNHYFQNRTNTDYRKYFPTADVDRIIIHDQTESRYWVNESLLRLNIDGKEHNIANAVIEIINEYINTKRDAFSRFIKSCHELQKLQADNEDKVKEFILSQLAPNVDARLFEIISYSILKYFYRNTKIYWGYDRKLETLKEDHLSLYKTGRTNANDGGIDFVMKPLGRFFQVTETLDFKKYFLDIDKLQRYPITFVIKSTEGTRELLEKIQSDAQRTYRIEAIVSKYIESIEEIINIPTLADHFEKARVDGFLANILEEIILQSKVEFNYDGDDDSIEEDDDEV